jgi:hypothetical protein
MTVINSLFCILLALNFASPEDSLVDSVKYQLIEDSFENVALALDDDQLIVTYENRIYRDEMRAAREIMTALSPLVKEGMSVVLIPQSRGVPLFAITEKGRREEGIANRDGGEMDSVWKLAGTILNGTSSDRRCSGHEVSFDVDSAWRELQNPRGTGFWSHRFGIVLHPQLRTEFGNASNTVRTRISLAPEANASLWKGMLLSAQLVIPVQNDFEDEGKHWSPGLLTLNQTLRLPHNTFASATAGYFTRRRYGTDLEVRKYLADGRWSVGANVGYTGYAAYIKGVWFYSRVGRLTGLFDVEYWFPRLDFSMRVTFGKFLYEDKGLRFDVARRLGEGSLGFYAVKTEGGENVGFNVRIPIFPAKYLSVASVRIGPARDFRQEYRYSAFSSEGVWYDTGNSIDEFIKKL